MPKIIKRLTDNEVKNAPILKKDYKLYDGDGLQLLVRTSGTKVWQYPYQFKDKKSIYTIGEYHKNKAGTLGLKEARIKRHEVRALLNNGIDPNQWKKEQAFGANGQENTTFEALGREWHSKNTWVPKYSKNVLKSLECDVFPFIGSKQITDVSRKDIIEIVQAVEKREAYDVARRVCQRCVAIFQYAIDKDVCDKNPALGRSKIVKHIERKNRPHFKERQLPEFLHKLSNYHGRDYGKMAMQLLVLTFLRPGEVRNLRGEDVNFKNEIVTIPADRMKMSRDHVVPLSKQALELLQELKKITGSNELLFPSIKNNGKPVSDVTLTKVLRVMGYVEDKKVVPHGFRHTASTLLNEHGFNSDWIERQLAHVQKNSVRRAYNHAEYLSQRREMMQWYADHLDGLKATFQNG